MESEQPLEDFEGEEKRKTVSQKRETKLAFDAEKLIEKAKDSLRESGVEITSKEQVLMATQLIVGAHRKDYNKALMETIKARIDSESLTPRQLSPEQERKIMETLEARFNSRKNIKRHPGIEWTRVKKALLASPEALWSIHGMESKGHEPDVYHSDEKGFDIGTCSRESPENGSNCVYDEKTADKLRANNPGTKFNGSAKAMAKALGVEIMTPDQYKNQLQKTGSFDSRRWCWLKADDELERSGSSWFGDRFLFFALVDKRFSSSHHYSGSWRGSLRVNWAD